MAPARSLLDLKNKPPLILKKPLLDFKKPPLSSRAREYLWNISASYFVGKQIDIILGSNLKPNLNF